MIHTITPYARASVWPVFRPAFQVNPAAETARVHERADQGGTGFSDMLARATPARHRNPDREEFSVPARRMDGTSPGRVINRII